MLAGELRISEKNLIKVELRSFEKNYSFIRVHFVPYCTVSVLQSSQTLAGTVFEGLLGGCKREAFNSVRSDSLIRIEKRYFLLNNIN